MTDEICPIQFQSNSYTVDEMDLVWFGGSSIVYSVDFFSMNSKVTSTDTSKCSGGASTAKERRPCLKLDLNISQVYKGFVIQVYLPGGAIVIMLWLGFFIHLNEVSARVRVVSIGFTAMITQMVGVMIVFPDTVQLEPLLVWNTFCLCMNLIAFIEFIVVHNMYITRELWKNQNKEIIVSSHRITQVQPINDDTDNATTLTKRPPYCITPYRMDKICMVLFMFTFLIFNVAYWSTFMLA
ncbi:glutamate-gated chloride channel-like [Mytilus californianus]|uniref:glutamate-gated chloride channel-like n=1 Tax=Mytilus californianus TaxID=6549 RepID=UPI0022466A18|nr:glutamate-gated chloride channel-like [Mytilus californianus]